MSVSSSESTPLRRGLLVAFLVAQVLAGATAAGPAVAHPQAHAAATHSPLASRNLWGTIDICTSARHIDTLGVRGSMPGIGRPHAHMFMRFRAQFQSRTDHLWHYVSAHADSGFQDVGTAAYVSRQSGWSFTFHPPTGQTYLLRAVIDFQWREGGRVVLHARLGSSDGHHNANGARPRGYSAATCVLR